MDNNFISFEMLQAYASFVYVVYMVVKFTKELPKVKKIPTKYYTWMVSFGLLMIVNLISGGLTFGTLPNILLYALSSIMISMTGNGIADFNKK